MEAKRKVVSYAIVAAATAYAVIYIAFLQGIPQTHYVFAFATILDLVAMPSARRTLIIAIAALYALYVVLFLVARLQSGQVTTSLMAILTVIFYVIEYGGFFVGLLYGMFA